MRFYDYKVKTREGGELDLWTLKGKVVLVVNWRLRNEFE